MDRFRDDDAVQVFVSTDAGGTGLNLQNACVLINLDVPWNPAVLDQRIARVHRLGQMQKVQAILLVAADSYEERVLGLVQGKRNLFDNVVQPEATEDVVSVSKRLAEVLAEDLAPEEPHDGGAPQQQRAAEAPAGLEETGSPETSEAHDQVSDSVEPEVRRCILELQRGFGARIERILGSGGGLLVILDQVDAEADHRAAEISEQVPVAVIDARTLTGLQRLGRGSPLADAVPVYEPESGAHTKEEPRLLRQARQKLDAAEVLIRQSCPAPALDLLLAALLASAAVRADQVRAPNPHQAGLWLYRDILPKDLLAAEDAALIMRALTLSQAAEELPEPMLRQLAEDVADFVRTTSPADAA
jgi:superfamily II DNA/RNA helicase